MKHSLKAVAVLALILAATACTSQDDTSEVKIIGGRLADYQPFMIRMSDQGTDNKTGYCGGSWIAEGVILTAAHCVEGMRDLAKVTVSITKESDISESNSMNVRAIVAHPQFDSSVMHNDVALLFVEPVDHSGLAHPIAPIALNTENDLPEQLGTVTVIGWGNESSYGFLFGDDLRQVDVPVVGLDQCRAAGGAYATISDDEICAGDFDNGAIDSCQGDSGGPLIAMKDGSPVLVGVVSWGINCANKQKPGVYARVSSYTSWIYEQIGKFNTPLFANDADVIKEAIDQHCYTGFRNDTTPYDDDDSFELKTRFVLDQTLTRQKSAKNKKAKANDPEVTCDFNRLGLGDVGVVISKTNNAAGVTVSLPDLGQTWSAAVTEERALETPCTSTDGKSFMLEYSTDDSWLRAEGKWFRFRDVIHNPDLTGYEFSSCTTHETTITFGQKTDATTGDTTFVAVVESAELGLPKVVHELSSASGGGGGLLTAELQFQTGSQTEAKLSVVNKTGDDVHTWILECPIEITLVDNYGVTYVANRKSDSSFTHMFVTPVSIHGVIADGASIEFKATFKDAFDNAEFSQCEINGMPMPTEVTGI